METLEALYDVSKSLEEILDNLHKAGVEIQSISQLLDKTINKISDKLSIEDKYKEWVADWFFDSSSFEDFMDKSKPD